MREGGGLSPPTSRQSMSGSRSHGAPSTLQKNDTILAALQPACTTGRDHHKPTVADCTPRNRYEPDCTACWEFCMRACERACVREPGGTARVFFLFLSFVKLNASG